MTSARFAEFYGASELSFVTVVKDDEDVPSDSVGRAFSGVDLSIRDHLGRRLPPGDIGQVFVASPYAFIDYACGNTTALLRGGDAVSVGDIGVLDERGYLRLVGRASRMIITSGKNVHPEEVERVLESHPAVMKAAVLGVDDDRRGERLLALLKLNPGISVASSDLIGYARSHLPLYKVPRRFVLPPRRSRSPYSRVPPRNLPRRRRILRSRSMRRRRRWSTSATAASSISAAAAKAARW